MVVVLCLFEHKFITKFNLQFKIIVTFLNLNSQELNLYYLLASAASGLRSNQFF